jgi:hypothetical protein
MRSDIIPLEKEKLRLEIARSIGPRILGLSFEGSSNLLAELPDHTALRPDGKTYHYYGGHRLWSSPKDPVLSYDLEDGPVEILPVEYGVKIKKQADADSGIEKSIQVMLPDRGYRFRADQYNLPFWSSTTNNCTVPSCTTATVTVLGRDFQPNDQTIEHTYDETNQIASVNVQPYTFDDNGNLLSDGIYTYTCDSATRLSTVSKEGLSTTYVYNGLGDKIHYESSYGNARSYSLDLNTDLHQILQEYYATYVYGLDRSGYEVFDEYFQFETTRPAMSDPSIW